MARSKDPICHELVLPLANGCLMDIHRCDVRNASSRVSFPQKRGLFYFSGISCDIYQLMRLRCLSGYQCLVADWNTNV